MAEDYTTRALVKHALNIEDGVTSEDDYIDEKITAASRAIDLHCGRYFWLEPTASARIINPRGRVWRDADGDHLIVPDIGTTDGLIVEVGRGSTWTDITADVEAEPTDALDRDPPWPVTSLLRLGAGWSLGVYQRARITVRWGWPEPRNPAVGEAGLIQTIRFYKRKDSPEGVLGSAEWGSAIRMSRVDPDVAAMLENLVLPGLG